MNTRAHTILKVLSILNIVGGILALLSSILFFALGAAAPMALENVSSSEAAALSSDLAQQGMTSGQLPALFIGTGLGIAVPAILQIIVGFLGVKSASNPQKIKPVWIFALIVLILDVIGFIVSVVTGGLNGQLVLSSIVSIALAALLFWSANVVKKEAGL